MSLYDAESAAWGRYLRRARRPLYILAFLLPLIIAYEICLAMLLPTKDGLGVNTVLAHKSLLQFFDAFGVGDAGGLFLGGLVIVLVLLIWHLLLRDPWRVDPGVPVVMAVESAVLAVPLLVASVVITRTLAMATGGPPGFAELGLWSKMAISVGAGLYEELVFRMLLIAVIHTLLVDLGKAPHWLGAGIAIVVSAAAFTWYHDLRAPDGSISPSKVTFYLVAGLYFGLIYTLRGFGIVVGVHAAYDIMTVLLPGGDPT